jgi:hypothetical protein
MGRFAGYRAEISAVTEVPNGPVGAPKDDRT